jgi:hypothetical protein
VSSTAGVEGGGKVTSREIVKFARDYCAAENDNHRFNILRSVYSLAGRRGVEAVALATKVDPDQVMNAMKL